VPDLPHRPDARRGTSWQKPSMNAESAKIVPFSTTNKRDWKWHRDRIAAAWGKQVESIVETGQMLIEAKDELAHGSYEAMVQSKLPFSKSTARRLKAIAENEIIANRAHVHALPPSWGTLYELTKIPPEILMEKLKDGSIHPKLERKDVRAMRPDIKPKTARATREELVAAIQANPNAKQKEAAAALGVSHGMYQRTRNELIGSGEIAGTPTLAELHERMVALARELPREAQIRAVMMFASDLGLNTRDWISTMTIGKRK